MNRIPTFFPLTFLLLIIGALTVTAEMVEFDPSGSCVLNNGVVAVAIDKGGQITSLKQNGSPNLIESIYLVGPYIRDHSPIVGKLVRNTDEAGEIAYAFRASNLDIELHYVILPKISGVYCFLTMHHDPTKADAKDALGFYKHVIKADAKSFTFLQSTDSQQGFWPPESAIVQEVNRDHTYLLNQSKFDNVYCRKYYSKYDYMHYAYEHAVYGLYSPGNQTGLYVINASSEWTPGGPTKSFQTVHDPAIINTIVNDEHMLENFYQVNQFPAADWKKLAGPFFIYINHGATAEEAWRDAKTKADDEAGAWPYAWMLNPDYPLERATVKGKLAVKGGSASGAWCVLADPGSDWQDQCLGYIYWTRADADGNFEFKNVRAGTYCVSAYGGSPNHPREENPFNDYMSKPFPVPPVRAMVKLGTLDWTANSHGPKIFQIGIPDRSTREFKLGNLRRQFGLWEQTPGKLDYTVPPTSLSEADLAAYEAQHWYYLQSESGSVWRIHFPCAQPSAKGKKAWLSLALAGTCLRPQLTIAVNGHQIWVSGDRNAIPAVAFGDDSSVRRCAVNGAYHHYVEIPFDAALLKQGNDNLIAFTVDIPGKNKTAGGIMYDAIKLEVEPAD